jgi:hypothetical protein
MTEDRISLRKELLAEFTPAEIEVGEMCVQHFQAHIYDAFQYEHTFRYLLEEARAAQQAIDKKLTTISPGNPQGKLQFGGGEGLGFYQVYENGAIFWRRDLGAWWVYGHIYSKYRELKAEAGILGYPITDETGTTDGSGRFNHFERGSIYWHPAIGAFEVHGDIRAKWQILGSEAFGYPITDETKCVDGKGRFNHFRAIRADGSTAEASIFWTFDLKAQAVYGAIRQRWIELELERGYLGYPVTSEMPWTDPETQKAGRISHFQRGAIGWTADDAKVTEHPERIILKSGHIGVSSVGGWVELILTSVGTFHYRGHLHNSGFVGLYCAVGSGLKVKGTDLALMAKKEVNVGGTASFDGRDEDWEDSGYSNEIRAHWDTLRSELSMTTVIKAELGAADFFLLIFLPLVAAATVVGLIGGGSPPEYQNCTTSGMHTLKDGNNNTISEYDGIRCQK